MDKRKGKAIALCGIDLGLALADGALTWMNTPDLKLESNPLVAKLGLGWGALFTANLIVFILYVIVVWYSFAVYEGKVTSQNLTLKEYMGMLLYGKKVPLRWLIIRTPKERKTCKDNYRSWVAWLGYVLAYSLPAARVVLVCEWLTYTFKVDTPVYDSIRHIFGGRFDVFLGFVLLPVLMVLWIWKEYKKAKSL